MSSTVRIGITAADEGFKQSLSAMEQSSKKFASSLDASGKKTLTFNGQLRAARKQALELANAYRQLDDAARNSDFGQSLKAQLDAVLETAGNLTDLRGDVMQEINNIASDTASWDAASQGIGVLSSSMQGLASVVGLAGGNCESFQRALVAVNAVQSVANTMIGIGNALQSQSALMIGLRALRTKLLSTSLMKNTAAQVANTAATEAASVSQWKLNAAMLANPYVLAAAAVAGLCVGIYALVDANDDVSESERAKGEAMAAVADQMDSQSDKLATQISSLRILQHEFKNADGDLNKMKSTMSNFDEVCENANINLYDQATAEKVLGELAPVMVAKYEAEAQASAFAAAIQAEYGRIIAKVADIQKRLAEGETIDTGDLEELQIKVDRKTLQELGLKVENGFDDLMAHFFQPSAVDIKLAPGASVGGAIKGLMDKAKKAFENGEKFKFLNDGMDEAYKIINEANKKISESGIDLGKLFDNNKVKSATNKASNHIRSTSKEMNTLLSTIEGCDNVIRNASTELNKLDHNSKNFASTFMTLNATILAAKKAKLELIDQSTLKGMQDAKALAQDILTYLEPNSNEWKKQNEVISNINNNIYEYLKKLSADGNYKALKETRSVIENIIESLPEGSDELIKWLKSWREINSKIDEADRKLQNMKLGIQTGSTAELKQQLDAAIKELDNYKSNTRVSFYDAEAYATYLDNVDKLEKKIRALAEQYANQKLMSNGVEITSIKPIDLTFSYKQSNIEKINEQIRYYSEKEKILKKYDIDLGDGKTFNIYQDELDATTKKVIELQKQAKFIELKNDVDEYNKSIKNLGYESIKNGVQGLGQMYSSVSGLVDKLNECEDPIEGIFAVFDTVFSTIDTIKSFIDGISELVNIINMLTAAKETLNGVNAASTAITTGEAIANEAAGSSASASAAEQVAASGASLEAVAANKALEKSLLDLAAAQIFAAHASIPVVGVGMAQGMLSAMMAAMTAQHAASDALQAFAEGGIVKGSTTMGDNVLIRANAGEMLLNSKQQANLFNLLNSGAVSNNNIEFSISSIKVKGSDLFLALSNHKKITHKTL